MSSPILRPRAFPSASTQTSPQRKKQESSENTCKEPHSAGYRKTPGQEYPTRTSSPLSNLNVGVALFECPVPPSLRSIASLINSLTAENEDAADTAPPLPENDCSSFSRSSSSLSDSAFEVGSPSSSSHLFHFEFSSSSNGFGSPTRQNFTPSTSSPLAMTSLQRGNSQEMPAYNLPSQAPSFEFKRCVSEGPTSNKIQESVQHRSASVNATSSKSIQSADNALFGFENTKLSKLVGVSIAPLADRKSSLERTKIFNTVFPTRGGRILSAVSELTKDKSNLCINNVAITETDYENGNYTIWVYDSHIKAVCKGEDIEGANITPEYDNYLIEVKNNAIVSTLQMFSIDKCSPFLTLKKDDSTYLEVVEDIMKRGFKVINRILTDGTQEPFYVQEFYGNPISFIINAPQCVDHELFDKQNLRGQILYSGLEALRENNFQVFDIKLPNMLYSLLNNKVTYIDFNVVASTIFTYMSKDQLKETHVRVAELFSAILLLDNKKWAVNKKTNVIDLRQIQKLRPFISNAINSAQADVKSYFSSSEMLQIIDQAFDTLAYHLTTLK